MAGYGNNSYGNKTYGAGTGTVVGGSSSLAGQLTATPGTLYAMLGNIEPGLGASRGQWKTVIEEKVGPAFDSVVRGVTLSAAIAEDLPAATDDVASSTPVGNNPLVSRPYWANVYTNNLVFKKSIGNFVNRPALQASINGGWDQITLELHANDTSANAPARGDIIKLYEQGGDGTVVYQGIIEDAPDVYDSFPSHELLVSGMVVELGDTLYNRDWSGKKKADISKIVADIVKQTKHLKTNVHTVPSTGVTGDYNFNYVSAVDALTECVKMAGHNFYWFCDQQYVWFLEVNTSLTPAYTIAQGVDFTARKHTAPITELKNYVLAVGGVPKGQKNPITALYDTSGTSPYGKKALIPPITYPELTSQTTLNKIANTVGRQLDRQLTSVELKIPSFHKKFTLAKKFGSTIKYFEPATSPFDESYTGAGGLSPTYVITNISYDGPMQTLKVSDMPVTVNDLQYMLDQMSHRITNKAATNVTTFSEGIVPAIAISSEKPTQVAGVVVSSGIDRLSPTSSAFHTVSWTGSPDEDAVTQYAVTYLRQGSGSTPTTVISQNPTTKIVGLIPGATYDIKVHAINAAGTYSDPSVTQSIQTAVDTTAPGIPSGLQVYSSPRGASLFWQAPTDADLLGYEIQVSYDGAAFNLIAGTGAPAAVVQTTSFVYVAPSGVFPSTNLAFQVRAIDYSGNRSEFCPAVAANSDGVYFDELIAGQIQAAGTITGGSIQTGSTGKRAVMDANGLRLYDGTSNNYGDAPDFPPGVTVDLSSVTGNAFFSGTVSASQVQGVSGGVTGSGPRMWLDFKSTTPGIGPLLDVNDGTSDRVQVGNLAANGISPAQYGMRVNDSTGAPIFDSLGLIGVMTRLAFSSNFSTFTTTSATFVEAFTGDRANFNLSRSSTIFVIASCSIRISAAGTAFAELFLDGDAIGITYPGTSASAPPQVLTSSTASPGPFFTLFGYQTEVPAGSHWVNFALSTGGAATASLTSPYANIFVFQLGG